MGEYTARDATGEWVLYQIDGDTPSSTEMARIQADLANPGYKPTEQKPVAAAPKPEEPGYMETIGKGARSAWNTAQAGTDMLVSNVLKDLGYDEMAEDWGNAALEQEAEAEKYSPNKEGFGGELAGSFGSSLPAIGGSAAGALTGAAVGSVVPLIGTAAGALAGGVLGGLGVGFPTNVGSNVQRQKQENPNQPVDFGKAVTAATGQSAVEAATDALLIGPLTRGLKAVSMPFLKAGIKEGAELGTKHIAKEIGKVGLTQAAAGAIEESIQQGLERWNADLSLLDSDEAKKEYIKAAVQGAIIQGAMGGVAGGIAGRSDVKLNRGKREAAEDAEAEAAQLTQEAEVNPVANEQLREDKWKAANPPPKKPIEPEAKIAGLLPHYPGLTQTQMALGKEETAISPETEGRIAKEGKEYGPFFTEGEYQSAVKSLRDRDMVSRDAIEKLVTTDRRKADAIYRAMLDRQDAYPTGSKGQYLKMIQPRGQWGNTTARARDYMVKPVLPKTAKPYRVSLDGTQQEGRFRTRDEAQEWIAKNVEAGKKKDATVQEDMSDYQYGLFEQHYEKMPNREERLVGEKLVTSFRTRNEADAAIKDYDPAFSPTSNKWRETKTAEQQRTEIEADTQKQLGDMATRLQQLVDTVVGENRAEVNVVKALDPETLTKQLGVKPKDLPAIGSVTEGVALRPADVANSMKNVIALAHDLADPSMSAEARENRLRGVLTHELVHVLRNLGLISPKEWTALKDYALNHNVPGKNYTHMMLAAARNPNSPNVGHMVEEGIAEMLRLYAKDPDAFKGSKPRSALRRMADFIARLIGLGKKYSADDVMASILGGEMSSRKTNTYPARNKEDVWYSTVKPDNFYLGTLRFLDAVKVEQQEPRAWLNMLQGAGLKPDEINWLGIRQWLQEQPKGVPVHKNDIRNYIAAASPKISTITRGHVEGAVGAPKWASHTQDPQGDLTGYQEVAFVMDQMPGEPAYPGNIHVTVPGDFGDVPVDNVLAFARFREMNNGGRKVLFIEEIQSDLHQRGSMNGYYSQTLKTKHDELLAKAEAVQKEYWALEEQIAELNEKYYQTKNYAFAQMLGELNEQHTAKGKEFDDLDAQITALDARMQIPNAPFKTTWEDYVIRRLIRHAAENGFDSIAWHGSADSVAMTEGYDLEGRDDPETGKFIYVASDQNVTPIINRYVNRLPRIANKVAQPFGTQVETVKGGGDPYLNEATQRDITLPHDMEEMVHLQQALREAYHNQEFRSDDDMFDAERLMDNIDLMAQVTRNQRKFDPDAAMLKAGVTDQMMADAQQWAETGDWYSLAPVDDSPSPFINDAFILPINEQMRHDFVAGNVPLFSNVIKGAADRMKADPKFMEWFKGSIVTEDDGTPKLVFKIPDGFGTPEAARDYVASTMNIPDSMDGDDRQRMINDRWEEAFSEEVFPAFLNVRRPFDPMRARPDETTETLRRDGYDAILTTSPEFDRGSPVYIPIGTDQVKSVIATGQQNEAETEFSAVEPLYSATAPMGQRVPLTPPVDRLTEVENRATYEVLAPKVIRLLEKSKLITPDRARRITEGTIIQLQDRMHSVGKLVDMVKRGGGYIGTADDPYLQEALFPGQVDAVLKKNKERLYDPLIKAVNDIHLSSKDQQELLRLNEATEAIIGDQAHVYGDVSEGWKVAELYLYAQHAKERNAVMRERNAKAYENGERIEEYDYGSGMRDDEADEILAWFRVKKLDKKLEDLGNGQSIRSLFRALIKNTNDIRVASGLTPDFSTLVDEETGKPLDTYQDYAPLRGRIEEGFEWDETATGARTGLGFNIKGREDRTAIGRKTLGYHILAHAIVQNEEAVVRAGKNRVDQSFYRFLETHGGNPEVKKRAEILETPRTKWGFNRSTQSVQQMNADAQLMQDPTVLKLKINGEQKYIKIYDPQIQRALITKAGLGDTGGDLLIRALSGFNRFMAAVRTSYNPEFVVSNFMMDFETALFNLNEEDKRGAAKKVAALVGPSMKAIWQKQRGGGQGNALVKEFEEFTDMGGRVAYYGRRDIVDTVRQLNKDLTEYGGKDFKAYSKKAMKSALNFVEDMNTAVENATRLSAYITLRDKYLEMSGDPKNPANIRRAKERAARDAKELTVNFNRGGEMKPFMNAMYLFYNASLQGTAAVFIPILRSKRLQQIALAGIAAGFAMEMLNGLISPEDDDGRKAYDKLPDYVTERSFVIMDPFGISDRGYAKIPMPYFISAIYNIGRQTGRVARGVASPADAAMDAAGQLIENMNPFGSSNSVLNFIAPTIIDPVVDLTTNIDSFSGRQIAPPESPFGVSEVASQRYWGNTNPLYITVADWVSLLTNEVMGTERGEYLSGGVEVSPNQLEFMVNFILGGTGTFVDRVMRSAGHAGVEPLRPEEFSYGDIPFLRRVVGNVSTRDDLSDYTKNRDRVLQVRRELSDAIKDGDSERYTRIIRSYPTEYRLASTVNTLENARRKVATAIKRVRESKQMTDAQKKERIKVLKEKQKQYMLTANRIMGDALE